MADKPSTLYTGKIRIRSSVDGAGVRSFSLVEQEPIILATKGLAVERARREERRQKRKREAEAESKSASDVITLDEDAEKAKGGSGSSEQYSSTEQSLKELVSQAKEEKEAEEAQKQQKKDEESKESEQKPAEGKSAEVEQQKPAPPSKLEISPHAEPSLAERASAALSISSPAPAPFSPRYAAYMAARASHFSLDGSQPESKTSEQEKAAAQDQVSFHVSSSFIVFRSLWRVRWFGGVCWCWLAISFFNLGLLDASRGFPPVRNQEPLSLYRLHTQTHTSFCLLISHSFAVFQFSAVQSGMAVDNQSAAQATTQPIAVQPQSQPGGDMEVDQPQQQTAPDMAPQSTGQVSSEPAADMELDQQTASSEAVAAEKTEKAEEVKKTEVSGDEKDRKQESKEEEKKEEKGADEHPAVSVTEAEVSEPAPMKEEPAQNGGTVLQGDEGKSSAQQEAETAVSEDVKSEAVHSPMKSPKKSPHKSPLSSPSKSTTHSPTKSSMPSPHKSPKSSPKTEACVRKRKRSSSPGNLTPTPTSVSGKKCRYVASLSCSFVLLFLCVSALFLHFKAVASLVLCVCQCMQGNHMHALC